jgi:ribonuclease VapC
MFVDASAICAILLREPEATAFTQKLEQASVRLSSAIAVFESTCAIAREVGPDLRSARATVLRFLDAAEIRTVEIGDTERDGALDAMERFGKGRHPARLNMGDCFAYACARAHGVPLLFKGDDFGQTDIEVA